MLSVDLCGAGLRGIKPKARWAILLGVQGVHFTVITVTMPPYDQFFQHKKQQQTQQQGGRYLFHTACQIKGMR